MDTHHDWPDLRHTDRARDGRSCASSLRGSANNGLPDPRARRDGSNSDEGRQMLLRKISLVLADVDGTLVTREKVLTDRAQAAVRHLRESGIRFAITSGRPPRGMAMLVEPLALDLPLAGFNGGLFVNPDLSIVEERRLPRDVAEKSVDILAKSGLDIWVYVGNDWLIRSPEAPHVDREAWTVKFRPEVVGSFHNVLDKALKIVGVSDDLKLVERCEVSMQGALGDRATAARSQPYYLDITHRDANKGFVVDYLGRSLGISPDEIATIGDQPNDLTMFKRSGLSIAMGNAPEDVKRQANAVAASYDDEGFAKAVEEFVLQRRPYIAGIGTTAGDNK
jgi:Cof subfamily protein (haloacid dehalogenase superfamily)